MSRYPSSLILAVLLITAGQAFSQERENRTVNMEALGALSANPVAYLPSVAFKSTLDFGAPNGTAFFLNTIPVIPSRHRSFDLIHRAIIPLIDISGPIEGTPSIPQGVPGDGAFGLGDINYSAFFSPAKDALEDWGVGPSITFPSATDDQLGSGKWSAGPTATYIRFAPPWVFCGIARQLWSFAGDSDRASVNQLLLQPIVLYGLGNGWSLAMDLSITANWNMDSDQRWTIPLGGGIGKLIRIGNQPILAKLEAYYNVEKPKGAPDWALHLTVRLFSL